MTPDELDAIRERTRRGIAERVYGDRRALLREVDRLRSELVEARLTAEEAWCDQ